MLQSAIQDVDYENELDLLYAVVTLRDPSRDENMEASLYFVNDKTGDILKKVPLPTWRAVSLALCCTGGIKHKFIVDNTALLLGFHPEEGHLVEMLLPFPLPCPPPPIFPFIL